MSNIVIESGRRVTLYFSLKLDDGQVVDSNFQGQPATFIVGDGNLPEGFEQAITGLASGDEGAYRIPPVKAFGLFNPENVREFPKNSFGADLELQEGLVISFADAANTELPGVVKTVGDEFVEVDFNHPLAGKDLLFEVKIINVVNAGNGESVQA